MKKHWLSDDQVKECTRCSKKFSTAIRKHHCRICGDIFCDDCSSKKVSVESLNLKNERSCEECAQYFVTHLPFLKKPTKYTLYEVGKTYAVTVTLSTDEKSLVVRFDENKKGNKSCSTNLMSSVVEGQESKVWSSHTSSMCSCFGSSAVRDQEPYCLSIFFSSETLDLQCENIRVRTDAVDAFKSLLRIRGSRSSAFIDETRENVALSESARVQREKDERQRLISDKYSGMREEMTKKYSATSSGGGSSSSGKGASRV